MPISSVTDFFFLKKASLKLKNKGPQIKSPVARSKKVDSNAELESTSVDSNTLDYYPEERINTYEKIDDSE